ncbi:MAG: hypothetical protein AB7S26_29420 [Sandaracinaceae bacterium]
MNRAQRRAHRAIFWVLGPLLAAALVYALAHRFVIPISDPPPSESGASR